MLLPTVVKASPLARFTCWITVLFSYLQKNGTVYKKRRGRRDSRTLFWLSRSKSIISSSSIQHHCTKGCLISNYEFIFLCRKWPFMPLVTEYRKRWSWLDASSSTTATNSTICRNTQHLFKSYNNNKRCCFLVAWYRSSIITKVALMDCSAL